MKVEKALLVAKGVDRERPAFGPLATAPIANQTLLEHALEAVAQAGVTQVAIAIEASARERVKELLARPDFNGQLEIEAFEQPSGQGLEGMLQSATPIIGDETFLIHLGDSISWGLDLRWGEGVFGATDALVLVQPEANGDHDLLDVRPARPPEKRKRGPSAGHLGVYVVGSEFGAAASAIADRRDLATETAAALALLSEHGGHTRYWDQLESWRYKDESKSLLEANRIALTRLHPTPIDAHVARSEVHAPVKIHPSAVVESSVIRGPVAIGPRCRIREAYIGPYTALGSDVEIEGAEMSYSVIMDGASVRHIRERLEASIVGPKAQVCREFRLPRAIRLEVGAGAEVLLA